MNKLKFLLALTTKDNDYQQEQAAAAEQSAKRFGVDLQIIYADNDAITQSQQLLTAIQSEAARPNAIIFEPVGGTALPQVARAAAMAGVGWAILNRDVDYINQLRSSYRVPVLVVTADHDEIGRIQGRQFAALLPKGGAVLYIQGPSENLAAKQRTAGMYETKPADVQVKLMKAHWTEESAYKTISSWLRLSTSHDTHVDLVAAQDDSMAAGARKAFHDNTTGEARERWTSLPFIGCDGLPKTGQAWVRSGLLAATVVSPPNTDQAIEMLAHAIRSGAQAKERSLTPPYSFPALPELAAIGQKKARAQRA